MRDRFLRWLSLRLVASPTRVLLIALLLAVGSAFAIPSLKIDAGHSAMFGHQDEHWKRFNKFLSDFGSPDLLFVIVEGGTAKTRREVVAQLHDRLPSTTKTTPTRGVKTACASQKDNAPGCVQDVVGRIALERLKAFGLLYLPPKSIAEVVDTLRGPLLGIEKLYNLKGLSDLIGLLARIVEETSQRPEPKGKAVKRAELGFRLFTRFITELELRASQPQRARVSLRRAFLSSLGKSVTSRLARSGIDTSGYLVSRDGKLHLAIVRPINSADDPEVVVPFVRYVEAVGQRIVNEVNTTSGADKTWHPITITITGLPSLIAAEKDTLSRDLALTSVVAAVGILVIFMFGFRSVRQGLLGFLPLFVSVLMTLLFVRLVYGGLNLVTSAFLPTVMGLGIDFAVHLLSRYNESRQAGADPFDAAREAVQGAGPGMITGGLTTAGAFMALTVNEFVGFVQLGAITAVGLVLALLTTLTVGTALLVHPCFRWLQKPPPPPMERKQAVLLAAAVTRYRWTLIVGGLLISGAMVYLGQKIPWSYNYLDLLPANTPAVKAMVVLAKRTDYSGEVAALAADSLQSARALTAALRKKPTVGRVESMAPYIPLQQERKLALIAKLRPLYRKLDTAASQPVAPDATSRPASPTDKHLDLVRLKQKLQELTDNLQDVRFSAKQAQKRVAATMLKQPIDALHRLLKLIDTLPPQQVAARLSQFERRFMRRFREGLAALRQAVFSDGLTAEKLAKALPAGLSDRLYNQGRFAIYVYAKGWIWDEGFLPRFTRELREVDPKVTGFPITHWEATLIIERGFRTASLLTTIVLMILLFIDFRCIRYTLLAVIPLALGMAWMWGGISLLGMSYNFANIIGFPLVIGIGVASSVHILHRYRQEGERSVVPVVRCTALAILLSALTTMAGFGSLALARHQGAASLGVVLLMGVTACLITSTLFLPALLQVLSGRRSCAEKADDDA